MRASLQRRTSIKPFISPTSAPNAPQSAVASQAPQVTCNLPTPAALEARHGTPTSCHACYRKAQRGIRPIQIAYALKHGTIIQRAGCTFYYLRRADIAASDRRNDVIAKAEGLTLLVADDGDFITMYRNPRGLRNICRKEKYDNRRQRRGEARCQAVAR